MSSYLCIYYRNSQSLYEFSDRGIDLRVFSNRTDLALGEDGDASAGTDDPEHLSYGRKIREELSFWDTSSKLEADTENLVSEKVGRDHECRRIFPEQIDYCSEVEERLVIYHDDVWRFNALDTGTVGMETPEHSHIQPEKKHSGLVKDRRLQGLIRFRLYLFSFLHNKPPKEAAQSAMTDTLRL